MSRALGIDYGDTRIGIALSDPMRIITKPYVTLKNDRDFIDELKKIINEKEVETMVVGYPVGMKGQVTKQTEKVEAFIDELRLTFKLEIVLDAIREHLLKPDKNFRIELRNFGVFEVKPTKPREKARNPKTLEIYKVPARRKLSFKAGKSIKSKLDQEIK